jgi:hypothetical protein
MMKIEASLINLAFILGASLVVGDWAAICASKHGLMAAPDGPCYWLPTGTFDWSTAMFACRASGGKLAHVYNGVEQAAITNLSVGIEPWIGLYDFVGNNLRASY